jgi:hypothetical protein
MKKVREKEFVEVYDLTGDKHLTIEQARALKYKWSGPGWSADIRHEAPGRFSVTATKILKRPTMNTPAVHEEGETR